MSKYLQTGVHSAHTRILQNHIMGRGDLPGTNYPASANFDNNGPHGNDDKSMLHPVGGTWSEWEWSGRAIDVDGNKVG